MYKTRGSIDRRVGKNDRARRGGSITRARSATAAAPRSRFRRPDAAPRAIYPRSRSSRGAPCARRISTPGSARCPWASGICPAFGRRRQSPRASSTNHSFIINHSSSIIARRRVPSRSIAHLFPPSDDARACFVSLVVASFVRSRSVIASKLAASVVGVRARASSSASAAASASRDVVVGSGVTATGERASSASRAGEGADMASTCAANDELAI